SSELVLTFGLGKEEKAERVTIRWPGKDGGTTVLEGLEAGKEHAIEQGRR
ncbi:MAG: ASPIC/UnbV domain-containing protein, partial [Gemmataceae bacterium]|nr:ASPIC/UnbV domain-containing protein [Gemmataceae bacterium]